MSIHSRFNSSIFVLTLLVLLTGFPFTHCEAQNGNKASSMLPTPDHIIVVIYENHAYSSIIGSAAAPHLNALANDTNAALFTQSYGLSHPSQPNYIELFSGNNQGVTNDNMPTGYPYITANLARQLIDDTKSFETFSEDLPSVGYDGATSGNYARKHNPCANWVGNGTNQVPNTTNQPFTAFPSPANFATLPTVAYVIPNLVNDMHNGTGNTPITTGDTWLYNNLTGYMQWALNNNSLLIVTFDEDDDHNGNHIPTIFYGPMVRGGQYAEHIDHYNILRTIEDMYGLPYAGNAAASSSITDCWRQSPAVVKTADNKRPAVILSPNPAREKITFDLHNCNDDLYYVSITDINGRLIGKYTLTKTNNTIHTSCINDGLYIYKIYAASGLVISGNLTIQH